MIAHLLCFAAGFVVGALVASVYYLYALIVAFLEACR